MQEGEALAFTPGQLLFDAPSASAAMMQGRDAYLDGAALTFPLASRQCRRLAYGVRVSLFCCE